MAVIWSEWAWTMKKWAGLYPLTFIKKSPSAVKTSDYTVLSSDYNLIFAGSSPGTFTLFTPEATDSDIYELNIKNRGSADLTVSGASMFTNSVVTTLNVPTGTAYTLRWDGTYWNTWS